MLRTIPDLIAYTFDLIRNQKKKNDADSIIQMHPDHTRRVMPLMLASADPEGGGAGGPDPPGISQVIWVSIGNKHLDPPGKCWTPSRTLKFEIDHLTSVK